MSDSPGKRLALQMLYKEAVASLSQLENWLKSPSRDWVADCHMSFHRLKGGAGILGQSQMYEISKSIDSECQKMADPAQGLDVLSSLAEQLRVAIEALPKSEDN